jgi:hypothetical protein
MKKKITTLEKLFNVRAFKRSVVVPGWRGFETPRPAAFMMNLPGELLLRMFRSGVYLHMPKSSSGYTLEKLRS